MTMRKNEKRVSYGQYSCLITVSGYAKGLIINAPHISVWSKESIEEYIEFLRLLLKEMEELNCL